MLLTFFKSLFLWGLVEKGYSPEKAYETEEEWERKSTLLQQSKNM